MTEESSVVDDSDEDPLWSPSSDDFILCDLDNLGKASYLALSNVF